MKLEVGMYVRTKYGEICKLFEPKYNYLIFSTNIEIDRYNDRDCNDYGFDEKTIQDITKTSHNIINLIEVGDYVNNEKIIWISEGELKNFVGTKDGLIYENSIKTIVTHEQFESMKYEVGE